MKKILSFILSLALLAGLCPAAVYAAPGGTAAALDNITEKQYKNSSAIDWYGAAALYVSESDGLFGEVDLDSYALADYGDLGSDTARLFMALIRGDASAASKYAKAQISGGELKSVGYYSSDAMALMSVMAYNRSVAAKKAVSFDADAALRLILFKGTDGSYSSNYAYDWNDVAYDDPDTLAGCYAAVSLEEFDGFALEEGEVFTLQDGTTKAAISIDEIRDDMLEKLQDFECADGLIGTFGYGSVWTTAWACYAVHAAGTAGSLAQNPSAALVASSYYSEAEGAMLAADWTTGELKPDTSATDQTALALAEDSADVSFFRDVTMNQHRYGKTSGGSSTGGRSGEASASESSLTGPAIMPPPATGSAVTTSPAALAAAAAAQYTDVESEDWFAEAAGYCLGLGYMKGTAEDSFSPSLKADRASVVTILWRMAGSPVVSGASVFKDVPADAYYAEAVAWAASVGIAKGRDDSRFSPEAEITREELAVFTARFGQFARIASSEKLPADTITDRGDIHEWAADAIDWNYENGIMNGVGNGRIDPAGPALRSHVAVVIMRLDRLMKEDR